MLPNWKNIRENPPSKWRTRILYHIGYDGFVTDGEYCRCPFPPYYPCISTGCGWINLIEGEGDYGDKPIFWDNLPEPMTNEIEMLKKDDPEFIIRTALTGVLIDFINKNEFKELVDTAIEFIENIRPIASVPLSDDIADIGESSVVKFLRKSK